MKKLLTSIAIGGLLLPSLAFAASDDVTLTSSVDIIAGGHTLDVVGDSNTIESIVVNADSFTITLQNTSKLKVSSPSFKEISHTAAAANVVTSACESNDSHVEFTATAETVITVTPKSITCSAGTTGGSSGSSGGGGGGGAPVATATVVAAPVVASTREAQIASILAAIATLQEQIRVMIAAGASPAGASACPYTWTRNLLTGSRGEDVMKLQQFLNSNAATQVAPSGAGSPGNETTQFGGLTRAAVAKWQSANGVSPAVGYFGPISRARANEMCK